MKIKAVSTKELTIELTEHETSLIDHLAKGSQIPINEFLGNMFFQAMLAESEMAGFESDTLTSDDDNFRGNDQRGPSDWQEDD